MGIDFDKMRKKRDNIVNKNYGDRDDRMVKLEPGSEYHIRILPADDGDPFKEVFMHYGFGIPFVCEKKNAGGKCPLCEMAIKIYKDKSSSEEEKKVAKKLNAQKRCYTQVLVRGKDGVADKPQVWGFSSKLEGELLDIINNPDYGDITDAKDGNDLVVKTSARNEQTKMFTISAIPRPKPSMAAPTDAAIKKIIEECPKQSDVLLHITYDEAKKRLAEFLNPNGADEETSGDSDSSASDKEVPDNEDLPDSNIEDAPF